MRRFVILTSMFLLALAAMPAHALTVGPVKQEVVVRPGEAKAVEIQLINDEDSPQVIALEATDAEIADESGRPVFVRDAEDSIADWVHFPRTQVTLAPGEQRIETITIEIPPATAPGGYYGAVLARDAGGGNGVALSSAVASLLLIRVEGDITESADVVNFSVSEDAYTELPVIFDVRVRNDGDVHVNPAGTITIRNLFGAVVAEVPVNANGGYALPGTTRAYEAVWQKAEIDPDMLAIERQWRNYAFGPHTAELTLRYGSSGHLMTSRTQFTVIPWAIVGAGGAALALILLGIWQYIRWVHQHVKA